MNEYIQENKNREARDKNTGRYVSGNNKSHGLSHTSVYWAWASMRERCNNKNSSSYIGYGSRGIKSHPEWETFDGFWKDMGKTYKKGLTLDRIDVNGNYTPENCRWITTREQQWNRTNSIMIDLDGDTKCLAEWVYKLGLDTNTYSKLYYYFKKGKLEKVKDFLRQQTIDNIKKLTK